MSASPTLPPLLAANPRLDQWVRFPSPGHVTVSTGRVEIGQGVLTAMLQIAADELDVSPDRIDLRTGDTTLRRRPKSTDSRELTRPGILTREIPARASTF